MFTAATSFTITPTRTPPLFSRISFRRVVFPDPRNPDNSEIGTLGPLSGKFMTRFPENNLRAANLFCGCIFFGINPLNLLEIIGLQTALRNKAAIFFGWKSKNYLINYKLYEMRLGIQGRQQNRCLPFEFLTICCAGIMIAAFCFSATIVFSFLACTIKTDTSIKPNWYLTPSIFLARALFQSVACTGACVLTTV